MDAISLFNELLCIQQQAKLYHLAVNKVAGSYATHKALQKFYEGAQDLTDGLIESYQGKFGIVTLTVKECKIVTPVIEKFKGFVKAIEGFKFTETWLQNQLDTIVELTYGTIYKLENLK